MAWNEKKYGLPEKGEALTSLAHIESQNRKLRWEGYGRFALGMVLVVVAAAVSWLAISRTAMKSECDSYCEAEGYSKGLVSIGKYTPTERASCLCLSESNQVVASKRLWLEKAE